MVIDKKIGIIGCGNMGGALARGLARSGQINAEYIYVFDKDREKVRALCDRPGMSVTSSIEELVSAVDFIILAVKPNIVFEVLEELKNENIQKKVIVSIAAGITINAIKKVIPDSRVVRVMPNTPALVGEGMTAISFDETITDQEKTYIIQIFKIVGKVIEVEEKFMNAVTAVSGSGPAYVFMFVEAMADAAVMLGIQRDVAYNMVAQTVLGSAKMVLETGKHPGYLKDMVCSPAGVTIEGVYQLEKNEFRGTVMKAIKSAFEKAEKMSEE